MDIDGQIELRRLELCENEGSGCESLGLFDTLLWGLKKFAEEDDKCGVEECGRREIRMQASKLALAAYPLLNQTQLLPGEHQDIRVDVNEMLANGKEWLATPNSNFFGRCPSELIGTSEEILLRETLRSAIYSGMA